MKIERSLATGARLNYARANEFRFRRFNFGWAALKRRTRPLSRARSAEDDRRPGKRRGGHRRSRVFARNGARRSGQFESRRPHVYVYTNLCRCCGPRERDPTREGDEISPGARAAARAVGLRRRPRDRWRFRVSPIRAATKESERDRARVRRGSRDAEYCVESRRRSGTAGTSVTLHGRTTSGGSGRVTCDAREPSPVAIVPTRAIGGGARCTYPHSREHRRETLGANERQK